jgi:hypothetical protein
VTVRLSTARQVADATGFKPGTILDWHEQGKLPPDAAYKFGPNGRVRFDLEKILAAFASRPGGGGEAPATPRVRPANGVVSLKPATQNRGGEDAR